MKQKYSERAAEIAERVRDARIYANLTQCAMAKRLEVARQTYIDIEVGKKIPKADILYGISEITGTSIGRLMGLSPEESRGCDCGIKIFVNEDLPVKVVRVSQGAKINL